MAVICKIKTKYGILNDCYRSGDLESCHGILDFDPGTVLNKTSLTTAANKARNRELNVKDTEISCGCKAGSCSNRLCKCFKNNTPCNSHCHKIQNSNCCNKEKNNLTIFFCLAMTIAVIAGLFIISQYNKKQI